MKLSEWIDIFRRMQEEEGDIEVVFGDECRPLTIADVVELPSKGIVKRYRGPRVNAFVPTAALRSPTEGRVSSDVSWGSSFAFGEPRK